MLDDFNQAHFDEEPTYVREDPLEPTAKTYYNMFSSAQKSLHKHTPVSQLDVIGRIMALKSTISGWSQLATQHL